VPDSCLDCPFGALRVFDVCKARSRCHITGCVNTNVIQSTELVDEEKVDVALCSIELVEGHYSQRELQPQVLVTRLPSESSERKEEGWGV